MATHSISPESGEQRDPPGDPHAPGGDGVTEVASEFSARLVLAENANLRERLERLEASIAYWAADVDAANAESARLRGAVEGLKGDLQDARVELDELRRERASLREAVSLRDAHIADLESRVVTHEIDEIDARRTRSRLIALRKRVRARSAAQCEEIAALRRMLALGHAARRQVEEEVLALRTDAVRNAKYLDRLEERLADLQSRQDLRG